MSLKFPSLIPGIGRFSSTPLQAVEKALNVVGGVVRP